MGLLAELREMASAQRRGHGATTDKIAAVEAALARLHREREAANTEILDGFGRRSALLLADGDDEIEAIDRQNDRLNLVLEKLDAIEPELLAQLKDLRGKGRREIWQVLVKRHDAIARAFLGAATVLCERWQALLDIGNEARAAGFESEWNHRFLKPPSPNVIMPDIVARLEAEFERLTSSPKPPSQAPAPKPKPEAAGSTPRALPVQSAPAPREARQDPPPGKGQWQVFMIRPGIELEGGFLTAIGDRINLPMSQARELLKRGAADYVAGDDDAHQP